MPCARQAKTLAAEVVRYRRNLDEHRRVWQFDGPQARRVDEDRNRRWAFGVGQGEAQTKISYTHVETFRDGWMDFSSSSRFRTNLNRRS